MHDKTAPESREPSSEPRQSYGIFKKFGYLLGAQWLREGLQTAFMIYLARTYSQTYGEFMLAINIGQIMLFISEVGLNAHLATTLAGRRGNSSTVLMQISVLKSALFMLSWLGMLGFIFWQGYDSSLKLLVIIISTAFGLDALVSSFFVYFQVQGRQDIEGKLRGAASVFGFGYGLSALFLGLAPALTAMFKVIETCVNLGGGVILAMRKADFRASFTGIRDLWETWRGGITFTAMAVCAIFYNKINLFFLQKHAGAEGVAQYSVTWQLVDGASILVSGMLLRRVLFPLFARLWVENREEFLRIARLTAMWLLGVSIPAMFILFIESDRIIPIIFGDGYANSVWMQRWLVPCMAFAYLHNLSHYLMICIKRERLLLVFYILGLLFNLILCSLLIPKYPLLGTALSITLTKAFVASMTVTYCQFRLGLFTLRPVLQLAAASLVGAALYFLGTAYVLREVGEALAVAPILYLIWKWRSELRARTGK